VLYADGVISAIIILALVYWLGRQIMSAAAASAATLGVMWLCVFRPAGIYILPYSYNSLHGALLGLGTLAILVAILKRDRVSASRGSSAMPLPLPFLLAGIVAGLTMVTKTEMGLAVLAAGIAAAVLAAYPDARRGVRLAAVFVASAACFTVAVYAMIAARVGWSTLVSDSWLLLYNIAPELRFYNNRISGFEHPLRSIERMLIAAMKLGIAAAIIAAISGILANATRTARAPVLRPWWLLAAAIASLIVMSATTGLDPDKGPFLAMPFLLVGLLLMQIRGLRAEAASDTDATSDTSARTAILITYTVYALASLARMILHVRSGGAYGSFLLPVSIVIFTYLWVGPFADGFRDARAGRVARTIVLALIIADAAATAGLLAYRYRTRNTVTIATARGTMIAEPDVGQAWNEALAYIERNTQPGDAVAVMPEGTSLDFLSGRRNPLREEITTPGFLDAAGEARAIRQLQEAHTDLILITNRSTAEFGPAAFGRDYCQQLMRWIDAHYTVCAMFGPVKDRNLRIGDKPFFIRAYCAAERAR